MSNGSGNVSSVVSLGGNSINSSIANSAAPSLNVPLSDVAKVICLVGGNTAAGANNFFGLYSASSPSANGQYQVPVGKTLYVTGVHYYSSAANIALQLGHGTAAIAAEDTGTAPTGAIYHGNSAAATNGAYWSTGAGNYSFFPTLVSFPASSFPFMRQSSAGGAFGVILIGYLV